MGAPAGQIARTEDFIRRNIAGQKTKQAQSRRKMLDKLDRVDRHRDTWSAAGDIGLRFTVSDHRGGRKCCAANTSSLATAGARPWCAI